MIEEMIEEAAKASNAGAKKIIVSPEIHFEIRKMCLGISHGAYLNKPMLFGLELIVDKDQLLYDIIY